MKKNLIIFTDLDGTLLDHDSYSWSAATPALSLAAEHCVPVVPCTSKTFAECLIVQKDLALKGPFIFENGAGIALPKSLFRNPFQQGGEESDGYWLCGLGISYDKIRHQLLELRRNRKYQFRGFGDMTDSQVAEATGLSIADAGQARQRRYSEPLVWLDNAKSFDRFAQDIASIGLTMTRGGRFVHIAGPTDKGKAMIWLTRRFEPILGKSPYKVALGDSMNDLPMLKEADYAVIIRPKNAVPMQLNKQTPKQTIITTDFSGPEGWNQAILSILNQAETTHG